MEQVQVQIDKDAGADAGVTLGADEMAGEPSDINATPLI